MRGKYKLNNSIKDVGMIFASITIAIILGSIILSFQGHNPFRIYNSLLIEPLQTKAGILQVLDKTAPLIFTGLASAIAFQCNIFNLGLEGQLYIGGLTGAIVGFGLPGLPAYIHLPLAILAAFLAGGAWAGISGLLKTKFNVHEVISTIMLNYIAYNLVSYLVTKVFRSTGPSPKTPDVFQTATFSKIFSFSSLNYGFILAILCIVSLYYFIFKTPWGWQIRASGENLEAAQYSGMRVTYLMMVVMFISGGIAGLAGAERVLGAYHYFKLGFSPGYGFDGIAVAIIGRKHPVGVGFAALFLGLLSAGGSNISIMTDVPKEWTMVLVAILLLLIASNDGLYKKFFKTFRKKQA